MKCHGHLVSKSIDISQIVSLKKIREACYLKIDANEYFVFPYGVVICWGDGELSSIYHAIEKYLKGIFPVDKLDRDEFFVEINNQQNKIARDKISLKEDDPLLKLTISHVIAQNLRLSYIESLTVDKIKSVKHIPTQLATEGKIKYSKKQIAKLLGEIYDLKSKISFEYSVLDKPEFFWENPEYDELYQQMSDYLELKPRIEILNKKIETINDFLSLLTDELNHRHSSTLEWIIILLILIEIVIFFIQDVLKLI